MWDKPLKGDFLKVPKDTLNYFTFNAISKRNGLTCFVLTEKVASAGDITQYSTQYIHDKWPIWVENLSEVSTLCGFTQESVTNHIDFTPTLFFLFTHLLHFFHTPTPPLPHLLHSSFTHLLHRSHTYSTLTHISHPYDSSLPHLLHHSHACSTMTHSPLSVLLLYIWLDTHL